MPQQTLVAVENNFTKGLITESTGLNFPENAATDTDNCEYTLIGDVTRRLGIDFEENYSFQTIDRTNAAISSYKWNNAGGDGSTQLLVNQVGGTVYFYKVTAATVASPLSNHKLASTVSLASFVVSGVTLDVANECTYSDGNGYLFIFHPNCDPIYCSFASDTITGTAIPVQIRDFTGVQDGLSVNTRPATLSDAHTYNLTNQGWIANAAWIATSTAVTVALGSNAFTVAGGLSATGGQVVSGTSTLGTFGGTVTSYVGTTLTINITTYLPAPGLPGPAAAWTILPTTTGYISTWFTAEGNYPSNADVWWRFKNASNVFDPATTQGNVTLSLGQAPQGHFVLSAFDMNRSAISGVANITTVSTTTRPTVGAWFQGRVWYTGTNSSFAATGNASAYSWSENIYFSQINLSSPNNFGSCYQINDPTSEELFDILPTDGGVIVIQGSGRIFKLFPIQNGMLVFAANGVWFITGSQGIGFSANDYTITKISNVQCISSTTFVDVIGLPYFWNEEGVYQVTPNKNGGLEVNPLTVGTVLGFFNQIPLTSKKYARGAYHPIDYVIQWIYKDTEETSVSDRYSYNRILNFNTYNKAFYPYSVDNTASSIVGINFISGPGGSDTVEPGFKYIASTLTTSICFADERDTTYYDWASVVPFNYDSYFITGYKLRGQAIKKFQPQYIQVWSRTNGDPVGYKIQGLWDYSNTSDTGRWSTAQYVFVNSPNYDTLHKRHKIRGHGYALQFKISSIDQQPFDIQGWAVVDTANAGT